MKTLLHSRLLARLELAPRFALSRCSGAAVALGLLLNSAPLTSAQTTNAHGWENQSAVLSVDGLNGHPSAAVCSSSGTVYMSGQVWKELLYDTTKAAVIKSEDRGNSWIDLSFTPPSGTTVHGIPDLAVASVPQADGSMEEQVFAIGTAYDPAVGDQVPRGIYRHRPNRTPEWEPITPGPIPNQSRTGITVDNNGNVYVLAYKTVTISTRKGTTTVSHALLVKGKRDPVSDTYTWSTAADFGPNSGATELICIGASVFVAGRLDSAWQVSKCTPNTSGSMTVTPIDQQFRLSSGHSAVALKISADGAGNLIVVGGSSGKNSGSTVVRRGSVNGPFQTIHTVSDFGVRGATVDPHGIVHVIGYSSLAQGWITRRGKETNGAWSWTIADQGDASFAREEAWDITSDSAGNVYAVGSTENTDYSHIMLRRRLAENAPTP